VSDRPIPAFTLDDFRQQVVALKRMGAVEDLLRKLPGMDRVASALEGFDADADAEADRILAILDVMTPAERREPCSIDAESGRRIAAEAGVRPSDVSRVLRQFEAMASIVEAMTKAGPLDRLLMMMGRDRPKAPVDQGRPSRSRSRQAVEVRPIRLDGPRLDPKDREVLWSRWEILARHGRAPRDHEPWFTTWNRDLRLWDFILDENPGRPNP
jgi:signal recognition particle subunit SRP54